MMQRQEDHSTVVLTIAGSDCSGGAGIQVSNLSSYDDSIEFLQADLKAFAAHGCYGSSVITALTAQNTLGVHGIYPVPPEFVEQQVCGLFVDISSSF